MTLTNYLVFVDVGDWFGGYGAYEAGFSDVIHYENFESVLKKIAEIWVEYQGKGIEIDICVCKNYEEVIKYFKDKPTFTSTAQAVFVSDVLKCEDKVLLEKILDSVDFHIDFYTNKKEIEFLERENKRKEKRIKELKEELEKLV